MWSLDYELDSEIQWKLSVRFTRFFTALIVFFYFQITRSRELRIHQYWKFYRSSQFAFWYVKPKRPRVRDTVYIRIVRAPGTTDDYLHARFVPQSTAVPRTPCRVINRHIILQLQRLIRRFHALPAVGAATSGGWQRARKSEEERETARPRDRRESGGEREKEKERPGGRSRCR